MAAYLLPTASDPSLIGGPQVGLSVGALPISALAAARGNVALPVGSQVGLSVGDPHVGSSVGGPPVPLSAAALIDPGNPPPPRVGPWHFPSRGIFPKTENSKMEYLGIPAPIAPSIWLMGGFVLLP
jgi:hypothetical protein